MSTLSPEPEIYTVERKAEFLLNNATDATACQWAVEQLIALGLDPTKLNPDHLIHDEPRAHPESGLSASLSATVFIPSHT